MRGGKVRVGGETEKGTGMIEAIGAESMVMRRHFVRHMKTVLLIHRTFGGQTMIQIRVVIGNAGMLNMIVMADGLSRMDGERILVAWSASRKKHVGRRRRRRRRKKKRNTTEVRGELLRESL
jgi:hypothetical protein